MPVRLTDALVRNLKPNPDKRTEYNDTERVGLRFRVSKSGNRTWHYQKKVKGGVRRSIKLGNYPNTTLKQARAEALHIEAEAEQGLDRVAVALEAKEVKASSKTVEEILNLYLRNHVQQELKEGQSRTEREQQLTKYLAPYFLLAINELTPSNLQSVIDAKQGEGKIVMANRIKAALGAFSNWSYKRQHIKTDIGALLQRAGREKSRERTPTITEVREIWSASHQMGDLWGPFIRLSILTGQRCRKDVLALKWRWIDFDRKQYEIPNPKNGKPHVVHLSSPAIKELNDLEKKQLSSCTKSEYVFSTTGNAPAASVSKAKRRLDNLINKERSTQRKSEAIEPWVFHDLRRSQATFLAEAGFDERVVDRIQNHSAAGSRPSAVAAVYNKAKQLPERAKALDSWAAAVTQVDNKLLKMVQK